MPHKIRFQSIFTMLTFAGCIAVSTPSLAQKAGVDYSPTEVLIHFKKGMNTQGAEALQKLGAVVLEKISKINVSRVKLPRGLTVDKAIAQLRTLPFVAYIEPNYIQKAVVWAPSDPKWKDQWGVPNMRTPSAWGLETGDKSVIIAILDTGVDLTHPDLATKIVPGWDFIDKDDQAQDTDNHGTHCAGIAAAKTNNGVGVAGICANCSIMPIRVLGPDGGLASDVALGIIWAVDHGAKVISMSLGGYFSSSTQEDAIKYALNKGATLVAAAGNEGISDPHYPAFHEGVIAVGAIDSNNARTSFSNHGDWVDVAAPGQFIMSTYKNGTYGSASGTSMATPFVAGLAGLLYSDMGTSATPQKVRAAIESTAVLTGKGLGKGRVDAYAAVKSVHVAVPVAPTTPTTPTNPGVIAEPVTEPGFGVKGYSRLNGSTLKAPENAVSASDDSALVLRSTESGMTRYLDVAFWTSLPAGTAADTLSVILEGRYYAADAPVTVYFWNWKTSTWDMVEKKTFKTADTRLVFTKTAATAYLKSTGEFKVRVYREAGLWTTFDMGVDYVRVVPGTPPSTSPVKSADTLK